MSNIWIAASDNEIDVVKSYISSGKHTANDKDENGYTPIHAAASYGHLELLTYLIKDANGDINIMDEEGDTPLHSVEDVLSAKYIVEELNADYKIKNHDGQTPLEKLEEEDEFPEVIEYLRALQDGVTAPETRELEQFPTTATVRYSTEDMDENVDPEQRRRLEEIVNSENPEEGLRRFLEEAVRNQFGSAPEADAGTPEKKRSRN